MSLETLELQKNKQKARINLKIVYDTNPVPIYRNAELIATDVTVAIKKNKTVFVTTGKAWLIEEQEYSDNTMSSYILQKTTHGSYICYQVLHDKKTNVRSLFVEVPKMQYDNKLVLYPFYVITALLLFTEGFMIYKFFIAKEWWYITNEFLQKFILFIAGFIISLIFLLFYIKQQKILTAILSTHPDISATQETFHFYIKNNLITITVPVFTGRLWHQKLSDYSIGIFTEKKDETNINISSYQRELKQLNAERRALKEKIRELVEKKMKIEDEIDIKKAEMIIIDEETRDALKEELEEFNSKKKQDLERIDSEINILSSRLDENIETAAYQSKNLLSSLNTVYDKKDWNKQELEYIIQGTKIIESLRDKVANEETRSAILLKALQGKQNLVDQYSTVVNERVSQEVALLSHSDFSVVVDPENPSSIVSSDNELVTNSERKRKKVGLGFDLNRAMHLIGALIVTVIFVSVFIKLIEWAMAMFAAISTMSTAQIILGFLTVFMIAGLLVWALNMVVSALRGGSSKLELV